MGLCEQVCRQERRGSSTDSPFPSFTGYITLTGGAVSRSPFYISRFRKSGRNFRVKGKKLIVLAKKDPMIQEKVSRK